MGNYKPFPFKIPFTRPVTKPFKRPFDVDNSCVLCLVPEIRTKWFDQSIYGNNGVITGCTKIDGRFGMGLDYGTTGADTYVEIPDSSELRLTTGGTIMGWWYIRGLGGGGAGRLWDKKSRYIIYTYTNNTIVMVLQATVGATTSKINAFSFDTWSHIAITIADTEKKIYVNGEDVTQTEGGDGLPVDGDGFLGIGNLGIGVRNRSINGICDETEILNKVFTAEEIKAVYEAGKPEG